MMEDDAKRRLKAAELQAKKTRLRIWTNYIPPATNSKAIHDQNFKGKVVKVLSEDCIVVADDSISYGSAFAERRVNLSSIRCSKMGNPRRDEKHASYAWEAKEFLRTRLIGRQVNVQMEYSRKVTMADGVTAATAPIDSRGDGDDASAVVPSTAGSQQPGLNVAELLVGRGFGTVHHDPRLFVLEIGTEKMPPHDVVNAGQQVESAESYHSIMKNAGIDIEIEDRKKTILEHSNLLAKSVNGNITIKESLLSEVIVASLFGEFCHKEACSSSTLIFQVVNLVEALVPVLGKFKKSFLKLPDDLLIATKVPSLDDEFDIDAAQFLSEQTLGSSLQFTAMIEERDTSSEKVNGQGTEAKQLLDSPRSPFWRKATTPTKSNSAQGDTPHVDCSKVLEQNNGILLNSNVMLGEESLKVAVRSGISVGVGVPNQTKKSYAQALLGDMAIKGVDVGDSTSTEEDSSLPSVNGLSSSEVVLRTEAEYDYLVVDQLLGGCEELGSDEERNLVSHEELCMNIDNSTATHDGTALGGVAVSDPKVGCESQLHLGGNTFSNNDLLDIATRNTNVLVSEVDGPRLVGPCFADGVRKYHSDCEQRLNGPSCKRAS
ncbi:hypothetical protein REPUB_Repub13aG0072000 [Reevesia pubescens]